MSATLTTRQQQAMLLAIEHVTAVQADDRISNTTYGAICHGLPPLILNGGLCQTLAFIESKASGKGANAKAYGAIRGHICGILGITHTENDTLVQQIAREDIAEYMRQTRVLLAAWVYYKRFAVSILNVDPGTDVAGDVELAETQEAA